MLRHKWGMKSYRISLKYQNLPPPTAALYHCHSEMRAQAFAYLLRNTIVFSGAYFQERVHKVYWKVSPPEHNGSYF